MSRTSDLAYRVQHEPHTLTDGEREIVADLRRDAEPARRSYHSPARLVSFMDRSIAKSDEQCRAGNLPRVARRNAVETVWTVASRTEGGVYYLLTENRDGELSCDCPADRCWHKVHVARAIAGEIGTLERKPRPAVEVSAAFLSGKRGA
jgi:hypothetical protein